MKREEEKNLEREDEGRKSSRRAESRFESPRVVEGTEGEEGAGEFQYRWYKGPGTDNGEF